VGEGQVLAYPELTGLDNCFLKLQKSSDPSLMLDCSAPRCTEQKHLTSAGPFFLTLANESATGAEHNVDTEGLHHHLTCMQDLFNRGLEISAPFEIDGQFDVTPAGSPAFPYHYPSNSPEAMLLRQERYMEIEQLLKDIRQQNVTGTKADRLEEKNSPSLKISRPNDVSPYGRRYKKQGLTYHDKYRKSGGSDKAECEQSQRLNGSPEELLICFCREPAGDSELITCSSETCMIGTFHLQCLDLDEPLEQGDRVYCMYCAENLSLEDNESSAIKDDILSTEKVSELMNQDPTPPSALLETISDAETVVDPDDIDTMTATDSEANEDTSFQDHHRFIAINSPTASPGVTQHTQLDGPRSPNQASTDFNAELPSSSALRWRTKTRTATPLPLGSNETRFEHLAPFICCVDQSQSSYGLTKPEAEALRTWKSFCPISRLLLSLPMKVRKRRRLILSYALDHQGCHISIGSNSIGPAKLSDLLEKANVGSKGTQDVSN
jgi:hypothetical protein